jgi:hypothetical protein
MAGRAVANTVESRFSMNSPQATIIGTNRSWGRLMR